MNVMTPNPAPNQPSLHADLKMTPTPESEPGLIDHLLMVVRYKILVIVCTLVGIGSGLAIALNTPHIYSYTTTLELGKALANESPDAVIAKVTNAFLPVIERAHGESIGEPSFTLGLDARNPKGTNLVLLSSKSSDQRQDEHRKLHHLVVERLLEEQGRELKLMRTNLELELEQARRSAAALKDQSATLVLRRTLLGENRTLTAERLAKIDEELVHIASNRDAAGKNIAGNDQVLTLMMLDMERNRERDKRDALQRQLTLGMSEEADRLTRDESDLQRAEQEHAGQIAAIQAKIDSVSETKVVAESLQSQKPTGMGRTMMVEIGAVLGLMTGIAMAYFCHALRNHMAAMVQRKVSP